MFPLHCTTDCRRGWRIAEGGRLLLQSLEKKAYNADHKSIESCRSFAVSEVIPNTVKGTWYLQNNGHPLYTQPQNRQTIFIRSPGLQGIPIYRIRFVSAVKFDGNNSTDPTSGKYMIMLSEQNLETKQIVKIYENDIVSGSSIDCAVDGNELGLSPAVGGYSSYFKFSGDFELVGFL